VTYATLVRGLCDAAEVGRAAELVDEMCGRQAVDTRLDVKLRHTARSIYAAIIWSIEATAAAEMV
jgi:pentatricopeptide repeat protein